MVSKALGLKAADSIEILYRGQLRSNNGGKFTEQWIRAKVLECDSDTWPLARLADGQLTEVRPYMTWRRAATPPTD
jgi:hypothetical protein